MTQPKLKFDKSFVQKFEGLSIKALREQSRKMYYLIIVLINDAQLTVTLQ